MGLSKLALEFVVIDGGSGILRGIGRNLAELGEGGAETGRQLEAMAESWSKGLKAMATAGTIKESLIDPGLDAAADLQEALANLQVNLDTSSVEQMQQTLVDAQADAARVAGPTRFSQTEVIGVQTALKKAGLGTDTILGAGGAAEAVAQLATGEQGLGIDQAQSAVVTLGSIFGLQGSEYAGGADLLSRAGSAAASDPARLAHALSQAPSAGAMGLAPGETLASLGVMGNMGIHGGAAGTSLNAFLRQSATSDKKFGMGLYGEDGSFLGLQNAAEKLRETMDDRSDQERQVALQKAFGDEGARFALGLLRTGSGGLESVMGSMSSARSLEDKVGVLSGTQKASAGALSGTARTTLANLYSPLLDPMTALTTKANEAVGALGTAAQEQENIAKTVSYGSAGAALLAAGVGGAYMLQGGMQGMGALRSLGGGLAGDAAGIAKGKAVEAASGVQPVYVTNWPSGGMGGAAGAAGGAAGMGTTASKLGQGALVGGAAAAGVGIGTLVQENLIQGTKVQGAIELALAAFTGWNPFFQVGGMGANSRRHVKTEGSEMTNAVGNKLLELLGSGLRLDVHVDQDGGLSWETHDAGAARAASRGEAA